MPVRTNQKALKANERKEQAKIEKEAKLKTEKEKELEEKWSRGAKDQSKRVELEKKKQEAAARKAERDRLLSEEESTIDTAPKDLGPSQGRVNRGSAKKALEREKKVDEFSRAVTCLNEIEEYSAGSIENAIDLLSLTENKSGPLDKLERHPERRIKSAWASFEEREMPLVKAERPGLRLSQYKQLLQKKWKKSEENPMNQMSISYNASREGEQQAAEQVRKRMLDEMRVSK